ncbi:glycosyltransferase family 4 protein, partial [Candidatus Saccharibacteria bacterium]|nr:glycosyltransferase family 4 protein [Candidatus Saccharibacteria bacterium]
VPDADLEQLHRVGKVYVMPSPVELQSISTLEAMASGQPVVAVDVGALSEIVHDGKNGYLIGLDDTKQLAAKVVKILTDSKLQAKFAAESINIASIHDINQAILMFEDVYKAAILRVQNRL